MPRVCLQFVIVVFPYQTLYFNGEQEKESITISISSFPAPHAAHAAHDVHGPHGGHGHHNHDHDDLGDKHME